MTTSLRRMTRANVYPPTLPPLSGYYFIFLKLLFHYLVISFIFPLFSAYFLNFDDGKQLERKVRLLSTIIFSCYWICILEVRINRK